MKTIGYVLIAIGFLTSSLISVLDELVVSWNYFALALGIGIVGIVLVRVSMRREVHQEGRLTANFQEIESSLDRIVTNLELISSEKQTIDTYDMRHRLDELLPEDINTFIDGRETISHLYGLQAYADVMSHFAAGERYINRIWSASADGYVDEVREYVDIALGQFVEARDKLRGIKLQVAG